MGKNVRYLIQYAFKKDITFFVFLSIYSLSLIFTSLIFVISPKLILDYITSGKNYHALIILIIFIFSFSSINKFISSYFKGILNKKILNFRLDFVAKLQKKCLEMDFKYTEDPNILNENKNAWRACQGSKIGIESTYKSLYILLSNLITIIVLIFLLSSLNIFIIFFSISLIFISNFFIFKAKIFEYKKNTFISFNERKSDYIENIMNDFSYGKEMRIYNLKNFFIKKYKNLINERLDIQNQISSKFLKAYIIEIFFTLLSNLFIFSYLIYEVVYQNMDLGNFSMFFTTIISLNDLFSNSMLNISHLKSQNLYINDYRKFLNKKNIFKNKMNSNNIIENLFKCDNFTIQFVNVSFKYPFSTKYIFKNLNLKIYPRQKLGIVGLNGSGKTTFIKLLMRLYEPTEGYIMLNKIKITNIPKEKYFKLFSIVFQDSRLFAFTVGENISLKEKYDNKKVIQVLKKSQIYKKISSFKQGINSNVLKYLDENGIMFSGGETQKLTLSRSLYKDGQIVILDEPTAALDAIEESNIYNNFNNLIRNKTAIYISHRLASTAFCDKIIYFEKGKIMEYGTHYELMKKNSKYSNLFKIQSKYYKDKENNINFGKEMN